MNKLNEEILAQRLNARLELLLDILEVKDLDLREIPVLHKLYSFKRDTKGFTYSELQSIFATLIVNMNNKNTLPLHILVTFNIVYRVLTMIENEEIYDYIINNGVLLDIIYIFKRRTYSILCGGFLLVNMDIVLDITAQYNNLIVRQMKNIVYNIIIEMQDKEYNITNLVLNTLNVI